MSVQTIAMDVDGVIFDIGTTYVLSEEGRNVLNGKSGKLEDLFWAEFILDNGDFSEIIDDSEGNVIKPTKMAITIINIVSGILSVDFKLEFLFTTLQKLTTESLDEWENENNEMVFGISMGIKWKYLEDEDDEGVQDGWDDLTITVLS